MGHSWQNLYSSHIKAFTYNITWCTTCTSGPVFKSVLKYNTYTYIEYFTYIRYLSQNCDSNPNKYFTWLRQIMIKFQY